jgi:hypothetical protein
MGRSDVMEIEDIKRRDRWSCKVCSDRFIPLEVYNISTNGVNDLINSEPCDLITLCTACLASIGL